MMDRNARTLTGCILSGCLLTLAGTTMLWSADEPAKAQLAETDVQDTMLPRLVAADASKPDQADNDAPRSRERVSSSPRTVRREANSETSSKPKKTVEPAKKESADDEEEASRPPKEEAQPGNEPREAKDPAPSQDEEDAPSQGEEPDDEVKPEPEPPRKLSREMAALRDRVRRTLAVYYRQPFNTRDNTAFEMMQACLAFGCNTTVRQGGPSGAKLNGITCLCWNYQCAGYELLTISQGHVAARLGYGLQGHPSQFLAVLAQSHVPGDYPIRVGKNVRNVADLVEYEKLTCRSAADLSFKLIGLMYYLEDDQPWENNLRETWSLERLVEEELARPAAVANCEGTQRVMGLSFAVNCCAARENPIEGPFQRAKEFVDQYQDYALRQQNSDGSWHPQFFAFRGASGSAPERLRSTGYILEWLAFSLSEDRLEDPRVVKAVGFVTSVLDGRQYQRNLIMLSPREIETAMHAVHALMIYDARFFRPTDPKKPPPKAEKESDKKPTTS